MTAKQNSSEIVMLITTHAKWHAELSNFSSMLRKVPLKSKKQSRKFYTLVLISRKKKKQQHPTTNTDRQSCRTMEKLNFQCVLRNSLPK